MMTTTVRSIKNRRREAERRALELEAKILEWAATFDAMQFVFDDYRACVMSTVAREMRKFVASPWPREEKGR
jgi:predicted Ser/Thr protein kinase